MDLSFIRDLFEKGLYSVHESFDRWQDAIIAAVQPLVDNGCVDPEYATSIFDNIEENGPYIFLAPHICMPHSKAVQYVHKPCICFMKVNQPVKYDEDDPVTHAELFFTIAATEPGAHLDFIETLVNIFDDEEAMDTLLRCQTEEEFKEVLGL